MPAEWAELVGWLHRPPLSELGLEDAFKVPAPGEHPHDLERLGLAVHDGIAASDTQNSLRSSRPATGGRPGDRKGLRPDRSDRRFRLSIATSSFQALRRPLESALGRGRTEAETGPCLSLEVCA